MSDGTLLYVSTEYWGGPNDGETLMSIGFISDDVPPREFYVWSEARQGYARSGSHP